MGGGIGAARKRASNTAPDNVVAGYDGPSVTAPPQHRQAPWSGLNESIERGPLKELPRSCIQSVLGMQSNLSARFVLAPPESYVGMFCLPGMVFGKWMSTEVKGDRA